MLFSTISVHLFFLQLLAGANINDVTANRRSALHIAAENNRAIICGILLENHIHANLLDANQNTGLIIYIGIIFLVCVNRIFNSSSFGYTTWSFRSYRMFIN